MNNEENKKQTTSTNQEGSAEYWHQVALDTLSALETAQKDVDHLKAERKELLRTVDRLKRETGSAQAYSEYETPPIKELIRGVRCGCYDMTVSISLFRGDNNGKKNCSCSDGE